MPWIIWRLKGRWFTQRRRQWSSTSKRLSRNLNLYGHQLIVPHSSWFTFPKMNPAQMRWNLIMFFIWRNRYCGQSFPAEVTFRLNTGDRSDCKSNVPLARSRVFTCTLWGNKFQLRPTRTRFSVELESFSFLITCNALLGIIKNIWRYLLGGSIKLIWKIRSIYSVHIRFINALILCHQRQGRIGKSGFLTNHHVVSCIYPFIAWLKQYAGQYHPGNITFDITIARQWKA